MLAEQILPTTNKIIEYIESNIVTLTSKERNMFIGFIKSNLARHPMTKQPKSKEQLQKEWGYDGKPKQWQHGFSCAMQERDDLLPIINQQAEEIEKLKADIQQMGKEYDETREDAIGAKYSLGALQSRFDELVKSLDAISGQLYFDIPTGNVSAFALIQLLKKYYEELQSLVTKAKGQ